MKQNKINSLQLSAILVMMMMASYLGAGVFSVIKASGVDAYLSVILGGIIGSVILIMFTYIFNYEPDLTLNQKIIKLFGKKIGAVIISIILLIVFSMGMTAIFNLTNFITSQFLPETPLILIALVFAFLVILINTKGIEVISRTCLILIVINFFLYLVALIGLIPGFEFSNIKPFLEHGLKRPMMGTTYVIGFNILPIFLLLIIPKNILVDKEKANKFLTGFYIFGIILMFFMMFLTLGNLGIYLSSIYQYPEYISLKNISILGFIDRIENIVSSQWIFGLFINLTMVVYFIANTIKKDYHGKITPTIITLAILFTSSYVFKNNTLFNNYTYDYSLFPRIIILIILTFTVIAIYLKRRQQKGH